MRSTVGHEAAELSESPDASGLVCRRKSVMKRYVLLMIIAAALAAAVPLLGINRRTPPTCNGPVESLFTPCKRVHQPNDYRQ